MPKSKHRRKPGGKAVVHPGRGHSLRVAEPDWSEVRRGILQLAAQPVDGLPLFDWAEAKTAGTAEEER